MRCQFSMVFMNHSLPMVQQTETHPHSSHEEYSDVPQFKEWNIHYDSYEEGRHEFVQTIKTLNKALGFLPESIFWVDNTLTEFSKSNSELESAPTSAANTPRDSKILLPGSPSQTNGINLAQLSHLVTQSASSEDIQVDRHLLISLSVIFWLMKRYLCVSIDYSWRSPPFRDLFPQNTTSLFFGSL